MREASLAQEIFCVGCDCGSQLAGVPLEVVGKRRTDANHSFSGLDDVAAAESTPLKEAEHDFVGRGAGGFPEVGSQ